MFRIFYKTILVSFLLLFLFSSIGRYRFVESKSISISPVAFIREEINSYQYSSKSYTFDITLIDYEDKEIEIKINSYLSDITLRQKKDIRKERILTTQVKKVSDKTYRINVKVDVSKLEDKTYYFIVTVIPTNIDSLLSNSKIENNSTTSIVTAIDIPLVITINTNTNSKNPVPYTKIYVPKTVWQIQQKEIEATVETSNKSEKYIAFGSELVGKNEKNEIFLDLPLTNSEKNFLNPLENFTKIIKVTDFQENQFFPYTITLYVNKQINSEVQVRSEEIEILIIPEGFTYTTLGFIAFLTLIIVVLIFRNKRSILKKIFKIKKIRSIMNPQNTTIS